jgi:sarcosine oxidase subunit alpha
MSASLRIAAGVKAAAAELSFRFNGRSYRARQGDTLAAALLANGVHLMGRSSKYHRPRGAMSCGAEESNAIVEVGSGAYHEPNLRATQVEVYEGMQARSVNCSPSPILDWRSIHQLAGPLLVAGFYNKTFMWPRGFWKRVYEPRIRNAAGLGRAPKERDPDIYDKIHWHCDVLVVGSGPSGLAAAAELASSGCRVVVCEESARFGGSALYCDGYVGEQPLEQWTASMLRRIQSHENVLLLPRTSVFGYYDCNHLTAVERRTDHLPPGSVDGVSRQRLWHFHAKHVLLATGAHERPLVFGDNDLPGILLANSVAAYAGLYSVKCGVRGVAVVNNDWVYEAVLSTQRRAGNVSMIVDSRRALDESLQARVREAGIELLLGHVPVRARGWQRVSSLRLMNRDSGATCAVDCDHVLASAGRAPVVHLFSHAAGKLRYDEGLACFVPGEDREGCTVIGAANGTFEIGAAIAEGRWAGRRAALIVRGKPCELPLPTAGRSQAIEPMWSAPLALGRSLPGKHFVDLQNDVTERDVLLASQEGFRSVEHLKRYTTNGMATDQGKTSNVNALALLAATRREPIAAVGTTTFRPPYTPVSFGVLAGRELGALTDPIRTTPMHAWHIENGAVFENVGQWRRARYYPRPGENMHEAVLRETRAVRTGVGAMDVSTLGKIEIRGPDAALFLNRIYTNAWSNLPVGSCRYGVMCKPDGMVFDDGVTLRLGEQRFFMTTTTGNAAAVLDWLEEWLQTEWLELRVYCGSVTEQWATVAVAGPRSRELVQSLAPDLDCSAAAFPFMTFREAVLASIAARVCRISFSGELAYEISVPSWQGQHLWRAVMAAGAPYGIVPYGTESMHVLRAEKGYIIIGQETDGTVSPADLGLQWAVKKTGDFIGRRSLERGDMRRTGRKQLVGFLPEDARFIPDEGTHLVAAASLPRFEGVSPSIGHVTSSYMSAALGCSFGLALIADGARRIGETVYCVAGDRCLPVRLVDSVLYDKAGGRRDGDA